MRSCSELSAIFLPKSSISLDCRTPVPANFSPVFPESIPLHLDIQKADLRFRVVPRSFELELPWLPNVKIRSGPDAEAVSEISIRDNEIPLMLRSLLVFRDILVDGPGDWDVFPDRVLVGEYGGLHLLFGVTLDWYRRIVDPESFPDMSDLHDWLGLVPPPLWSAPLGAEEPARGEEVCELHPQSLHDLASCGEGEAGYCRPLDFPSEDDPRLDLTVTPWIPHWLREDNGRLPVAINWLDLLNRFLAQPPKEEGGLEKILGKILLSNGERPWRLSELWEAGEAKLDLSEFSIGLERWEGNGLSVSDLVVKSRSAERGRGETWTAGVQVEADLGEGELRIRANLEISGNFYIPGLGTFSLRFPVLCSFQMKKVGLGFDLVPGSFFLESLDASLKMEESPALERIRAFGAWAGDSDLELPFRLHASDDGESFHFRFADSGSDSSAWTIDAHMPMALRQGRYLWRELRNDLELTTAMQFRHASGAEDRVELALNAFPPAPFKKDGRDFGIRVRLDWQRDGAEIISGGEAQFQRVEGYHDPLNEKSGTKWFHFLHLGAESLRIGALNLTDTSFAAEIQAWSGEKGVLQLLLPRFTGAAEFLFGRAKTRPGSVSFRQVSGEEPWGIQWDSVSQNIQMENLKLRLQAQGLPLPRELLNRQNQERKAWRREGRRLPARAAALGLDGWVRGGLSFNFRTRQGQGDLRLVGDRAGDIYLLDGASRPIAPPLLSRTEWRFRRFDQIHARKGYALGVFRLATRVNTASLARLGYRYPWEADVVMSHRDVMFKPGGIEAANREFYRRLLRASETEVP